MNRPLIRALQVRPFLFLWLSEVFALIGFNMTNFLLIIVAYALTGSNTAVSGIVVAFTLPAILFGIVAGVFVDRMDKKKVLFATNFIRAVLLLILVIFHSNLVVLYIVTFF